MGTVSLTKELRARIRKEFAKLPTTAEWTIRFRDRALGRWYLEIDAPGYNAGTISSSVDTVFTNAGWKPPYITSGQHSHAVFRMQHKDFSGRFDTRVKPAPQKDLFEKGQKKTPLSVVITALSLSWPELKFGEPHEFNLHNFHICNVQVIGPIRWSDDTIARFVADAQRQLERNRQSHYKVSVVETIRDVHEGRTYTTLHFKHQLTAPLIADHKLESAAPPRDTSLGALSAANAVSMWFPDFTFRHATTICTRLPGDDFFNSTVYEKKGGRKLDSLTIDDIVGRARTSLKLTQSDFKVEAVEVEWSKPGYPGHFVLHYTRPKKEEVKQIVAMAVEEVPPPKKRDLVVGHYVTYHDGSILLTTAPFAGSEPVVPLAELEQLREEFEAFKRERQVEYQKLVQRFDYLHHGVQQIYNKGTQWTTELNNLLIKSNS